MSQRALRLPVRALSHTKQYGSQWICRRCLATTQMEHTPSSSTPPPPTLPQKKDPSEAVNYDPTLPSSQRDYRLTKTDFHLKKKLPHDIPAQYLMHSTSDILHQSEREQRAKIPHTHKKIVGIVVSTGRMHKTVRVRVAGQRWNKRVRKYFAAHKDHLVHDPNTSLVVGDVVKLHRLRVSTAVHHVVGAIISPYGTPIDDRPHIPTADERLAAYKEKRFAKLHRRTLRREAANGDVEAIAELKRMGLDPGKGVEVAGAGKGEGEGSAKLRKWLRGKKGRTTDGAIVGRKGQILPTGVLPGGKHAVGRINERARRNKGKAMAWEKQAEGNLLEAKVKGEQLAKEGLAADSKLEHVTQNRR